MQSIPLLSKKRRRAMTAQKLQHLIPALPLLAAGTDALHRGVHGWELVLALFAIATSVLLLGTVVREIRSRRSAAPAHVPHGVDWFHVFAAGVIAAEAAERWHQTHHWPRPLLLTAAITLGLGLFHARMDASIRRRRSLRLSDEGVAFSTRPFHAFRAQWPDLTSIEIGTRPAAFRKRAGDPERLDLGDLENAEQVRGALEDARLRLSHQNPTAE